jgi:hypothetical protein
MHLLNLTAEFLSSKKKKISICDSYFTILNTYLQLPMQLYVKTTVIFRHNSKQELSFCPTYSSFTSRCVTYTYIQIK